MTKSRTKQQIAFDGVRVVWVEDTFTNILQKQVEKQFSMDGIIPLYRINATPKPHKKHTVVRVPSFASQKQKQRKSLDGIHLPWRESFAV